MTASSQHCLLTSSESSKAQVMKKVVAALVGSFGQVQNTDLETFFFFYCSHCNVNDFFHISQF